MIPEKITNVIENLLIKNSADMPFYGEFNLFINFIKREEIATIGVNTTINGINCYYNDKFLDTLTEKEMMFVLLHEDFHLLLHHNQRDIQGYYNHTLANIACDAIVNTILVSDIDNSVISIPKDEEGRNTCIFLDKDYKGEVIFEDYYEYLMKKYDKYKEKHKNDGKDDNGNGNNGNDSNGNNNNTDDDNTKKKNKLSKSDYGKYVKDPKNMDKTMDGYSLDHIFKTMTDNEGQYLDVHIDDEISSDMKRDMINECINTLKNRGLVSANMENTLAKLIKKKKDYLTYIKRAITNEIFGFNKDKTILRPSRRNIKGIKGNKKYSSKINCILDTSGSMCNDFEKVLSYIYNNNVVVNLIQCDAEIKRIDTIKNTKHQLEHIKIDGLGGTILQPAVDYIREHLNKYNTLILSDGWCDELDNTGVKGNILVITTDKEIIFKNRNKIKQITIEK